MTKRIVTTTNLEIFKRFISKRYNGSVSTTMADPNLKEAIRKLTPGCFVFVYKLPNGKVEALAMHKFEYAISTMVNRECAFNLQMRFLTKEERSKATSILDAEGKDDLK